MDEGWSKTARYLTIVIALAGFIWALSAVKALIGPLVIAALLAYILNPAVTLSTTHTKLSHKSSASLVYLLLLTGLVAVSLIFGPMVIGQARNLALELQGIRGQLEGFLASPMTFLGLELPLDETLTEFQRLLAQLLKPEKAFKALQAATTNLAWILVILVTTYYLLRDWERLREWLFALVPGAYQSDLRRLHQEIKVVWQAYLRGQLLLMLLVGVLTGLGAATVGLRGAAVLGLLAGALDLIPSLGPTAATVTAAVIAWFEGSAHLRLSNAGFTVLVVALYVSIQLLEEVWLRPRIMGQSLKLHPSLVFVAVVGALALGGVLIALIIVPLLGSAGIVGRYLHRRILGLVPWPKVADSSSINHSSDTE
jgi:predicted PurR-regulated permease PerM